MAGDPYSRMVGFLKVVLPLIALGLLSTLFLVSDRIEPGSSIPFAEGEITERITGQQVTGPLFTSTTAAGDLITMRATEITQGAEQRNQAESLSGRIELVSGSEVVLVADQGVFRLSEDRADLSGNVLIESSNGYLMRTDRLSTGLSTLDVTAPGEVRATGPAGYLTAGAMRIAREGETGSAQLLFTGGVKLIYDPKQSE